MFFENHLYAIKLCLLLTLTLATLFLQRTLFSKLAHPTKIWQSSLIYALSLPLKLYIFFFCTVASIKILSEAFPSVHSFFSPWFDHTYKTGGLLLFLWICFRFFSDFENKLPLFSRATNDLSTTQGFLRILKIAIFFLSGLSALQLIGIPLSAIVAFGSMGSIALGFAAKDLLSNLFGRLMIFLDRQFEVGDWIRSPDREIEGFVEHIGWRLTRVKTLDKRPLFIPNSVFSTIVLENPSRMSHRRIKTIFRIEYEDHFKIGSLLNQIEGILKTHPHVDTKLKHFANLISFGLHGLEIEIQAFITITETTQFQKIQEAIFLQILELIQKHNMTIASANKSILLEKI